MLVLTIVLRLLHIVFGAFWVGAALMLTYFISPAVQATQENGQKFFSHVLLKTNLTKTITYSAFISVIAGLALYWIRSGGFQTGWMASGPGIGFGLGGLVALIGLHFGYLQGKRSTALAQLGQEIREQGTPPTESQLQTIQKLQAQLKTGGQINAISLLVASLLMATARYWIF